MNALYILITTSNIVEGRSIASSNVITADDKSAVVGVTSVDNRLFVLRRPSEQGIQVYDLEIFTFQQTLKVTGLGG
jgi:hypothetical protein